MRFGAGWLLLAVVILGLPAAAAGHESRLAVVQFEVHDPHYLDCVTPPGEWMELKGRDGVMWSVERSVLDSRGMPHEDAVLALAFVKTDRAIYRFKAEFVTDGEVFQLTSPCGESLATFSLKLIDSALSLAANQNERRIYPGDTIVLREVPDVTVWFRDIIGRDELLAFEMIP